MKRDPAQTNIARSVLDRLIDDEPGVADRLSLSRAESLRMAKNSLKRDLEWLLNTRRGASPNALLRELNRSVFAYGMPDLTSYSLDSAADRARLLRELTVAIERFEPRLDEVTIVPVQEERTINALRFRIEALLQTEAAPEPVFFDTVLELSSGEYQVKGEA